MNHESWKCIRLFSGHLCFEGLWLERYRWQLAAGVLANCFVAVIKELQENSVCSTVCLETSGSDIATRIGNVIWAKSGWSPIPTRFSSIRAAHQCFGGRVYNRADFDIQGVLPTWIITTGSWELCAEVAFKFIDIGEGQGKTTTKTTIGLLTGSSVIFLWFDQYFWIMMTMEVT